MTKFVFNINGTDYPIAPFVFKNNGSDIYRCNYTGAYGTPPGTYFYNGYTNVGVFTDVESIGDVLSLKDAFYSLYLSLKAAGVSSDHSNDRIKAIDVKVIDNGNEIDMSIYYAYQYDIASPQQLRIWMFGKNNIHGSYGLRETVLNYAVEGTAQNEQIAIAQIHQFNCPVNAMQYEDSNTIYIGCIALCENLYVKRNVSWLPDQLKWVTNPVIAFEQRPFYDAESVPQEAMGMMQLGQYEVFIVEHYGYPSLSTLPDDNPYLGGNGYSLLNTADIDALYIDNIEWTDDEQNDHNSQDDTIDPHNYSNTSYTETSDPCPPDGLPNNSVLDTGFMHAYCLGESNSRALANYMLTDTFLNAVKHLYDNTIDYILSYTMVPVTPASMTKENIKIGGVDTGIEAQRINNNWLEWKASCRLEELWGGFIDYTGTEVSCYIPFVGIQPLNVDDVMNGSLLLDYRIDVLTGIFNCSLSVNNSRKTNGVLYTYQGTMAYNIPLFSSDVSNKLNSVASAIANVAGVAGGNLAAIPGAAMSVVEAVAMKPSINRSGSLNGDAGFLGNYTPYLIVNRPVQALPKLYSSQIGYATRSSGTISIFKGYLEVDTADLSGIACTDSERDEILSLLKGGVYV